MVFSSNYQKLVLFGKFAFLDKCGVFFLRVGPVEWVKRDEQASIKTFLLVENIFFILCLGLDSGLGRLSQFPSQKRKCKRNLFSILVSIHPEVRKYTGNL